MRRRIDKSCVNASRIPKGMQDPRYRNVITQLVRARQELGLSQGALAERLGRHQQFVSRYEIGERRLDFAEFVDVAVALQLDPAALLWNIAEPASRSDT
jgi:transcriptional regulator with XRE-family HTH domain